MKSRFVRCRDVSNTTSTRTLEPRGPVGGGNLVDRQARQQHESYATLSLGVRFQGRRDASKRASSPPLTDDARCELALIRAVLGGGGA